MWQELYSMHLPKFIHSLIHSLVLNGKCNNHMCCFKGIEGPQIFSVLLVALEFAWWGETVALCTFERGRTLLVVNRERHQGGWTVLNGRAMHSFVFYLFIWDSCHQSSRHTAVLRWNRRRQHNILWPWPG